MKYTNLEKHPEFVEKTLNLIETSFGYTPKHSFAVDFFPLMKKENHSHCHIITDNNNVVAHIGVLKRNLLLNEKLYPIYMYGGIAVHEDYRGKGLFKKFLEKILDEYKDCALHFLWSEKIELYKKLSFYPCINLYEHEQKKSSHSFKVINALLEQPNINTIKSLYTNDEIRIHRDDSHWNELVSIKSANLFLIESEGKILNYFIKDKGEDLKDIIHEYGFINQQQLEVMQNYGKVWSSKAISNSALPLYSSLVSIGKTELFKKFIFDLCEIDILAVEDNNVRFQINNETFTQSQEDFLQGVFGPGKYQELIDTNSIYICGLDSI